jgi:hypothetical protein
VLILCIYLLLNLLPFDLDIEYLVRYYSLNSEDQISSKILGFEWAILACSIFIIGTLFWHTVFLSVVRGNDFCFGKIPRIVLLKSFDYFWYTIGFSSIVLTIIGLNAEEAESFLEYHRAEYKWVHKVTIDAVKKRAEHCNEIEKSLDLHEPKADIAMFNNICKRSQETGKYSTLRKECAKVGDIWDWGSNDSAYYNTEERPNSLTNALNHMDLICSGYGKLEDEKKQIKIYEHASNRIFNTTNKNNPAILLFLPLFISLRLVKTSSEFCEAIRDSKKK